MITSLDQLDMDKTYSYADYLTWRFSEYVELIRGRISRMSAPSRAHQFISGKIFVQLDVFLNSHRCHVYSAPFDVRLHNFKKSTKDKEVQSVVQPDICVICDLSKLDKRGCVGSPDLIVEILSKGTAKKDYIEKFELYEENGVKEYWIVSPNDRNLVAFDLKNGKYQYRKTYFSDDKVTSLVLEGFELELEKVFLPEEDD
jgi:Uma2 family endonuclease